MKTVNLFFTGLLLSISIGTLMTSCEDGENGIDGIDGENGIDGVDGTDGEDGVDGEDGEDGEDFEMGTTMFSDKSATPPLVAMSSQFNFVEAYSLVSTPDVIGSDFQLAGSADGAGFLQDGEDYIFVTNCEDSYAVARIRFDENLVPISGDYLLDSGVADFARQCSATMWEADIHGGSEDIFLSASESRRILLGKRNSITSKCVSR